METFIKHIEKVLKKDNRLWSEDDNKKLLKNKLVELVSNDDEELLELLLNDSEAKKHFFKKIKDSTIFLKDRFLQFATMNEFLPDSFTAFENEIGLSDDKKLITQKDEISLVFPHKDCFLEGGQRKEEMKRDEIFYNTILAPDEIDRIKEPKVLVNWKKFDKDGKHEVKEISKQDNLVIKGNNLLALYSLLPKYRGGIKLIYIDPPYNTGNDGFKYNDRFNHSTWLTFIQNRLEVAKDLLSDDGLIFIQCDDNEQPYLKVLMDEIFNRLHQSTIYIQVRYAEKQLATAMRFHKLIETIFVYSKTEKPLFFQDLTDYDVSKYEWEISELGKPTKTITLGGKKVDVFEKGEYKVIKKEKPSENLLKEIWASGKILDSSSTGRFFRDFLTGRYDEDSYGVLYKVHGIGSGLGYRYITGPQKEGATKGKYYQEIPQNKTEDSFVGAEKAISNFYDMASSFGNCRNEGGVELRSGKKPEALLEQIIKIATKPDDLVLDFFAGSGTVGAVAHKMGRRYILIEQMDYIHDLPEARLINVINGDQTGISKAVNWKGGGSFIYTELLEWNQRYISQLEKAKTGKEVLDIYKKIEKEQFYKYKYEPKKFNLKAFKELDLKEQKKALLDILDMNHLFVNRSSMDDTTFKVDEKDKKLTKAFYEEK